MNLPPYGDQFRRVDSFFSTLKVAATPDPSLKVSISAGGFWLNTKKYIEYKGGVSPDFILPTVNSKLSLVTINHNGQVRIVDGEQSSHPMIPDCPSDCFPVAVIFLSRTDTKITSDKIFDIRCIFNSISMVHSELDGISDLNTHPITSITGLNERLNDTPTFQDVRSLLLDKSDSDGTVSSIFVLNKDHVGTPVTDVTLEVNRGALPNVFIRWNEGIGCWEYTNDGQTIIQLTSIGPNIIFPPATSTTLGGIKVGANLTVGIDGTINAVQQSEENFTSFEKAKLLTVEEFANKYIHPFTHPASMISQEFGLRFMTDSEKSKLVGIEELANKYVHPTMHQPEIILQDPSHRYMTDVEKTKLNGIEEHANRYIHPNTHTASIITEDPNHRFISENDLIKLAGIQDNANNYVHPVFHPASMIIPDSVNRFVSDIDINNWNNKVSPSYVDLKIEELIGNAPGVLNTLSEIADALSDDQNFASTMTIELEKKVDKVSGLNLSQENFTSQEKNKLSSIEDFANKYIHPLTHSASMIVEDSSRRFVTDIERQKINNIPIDVTIQLSSKVDKDGIKQLSDQNYTLIEKNKLASIEDNANSYTHPLTHSSTMITYTPDNSLYWNTQPTTIQEAINKLAAVVYALNGNVKI